MTLLDELEKKLQLKTRELNIVLELDKIRDKFNTNPEKLTEEIVKLIQKEMDAKFCALIVNNPDSKKPEIQAYIQIEDELIDYRVILKEDITKRAVNLQSLSIWNTKDLIKDRVIDSLQVATIPLRINRESLGSLLVGRDRPFSADDKKIIDTATNMIDSAIVQCRDYNLLQQKIKELQTIYKIDRIRDRSLPLEEMLNSVLIELNSTLNSHRVYYALQH